ncbi:MAG: hypothetical protein ACI857_002396 [Arenicella sp.]
MNLKTNIIFTFLLLASLTVHGQNSIKLEKQQTTFFYTQLNLHGGFINDVNGARWDVTNRGPQNQLAFQLLSKNRKTLQKGYIRTLRPSAYSLRFSVVFDKTINALGQREADFKLKLLNTWVKFDTKWDRTSFWFGNRSIPFGHNPKLDPVSSFMTNLIKMDIGFVQDLGFFMKTPLNSKFDLELSVTSGGLLNKPLLICDNLINDSLQSIQPKFKLVNYQYENTWLITSRIGNQSFKKNEFGFIGVSGRIFNTLVPDDRVYINRIGADWVFKYHEKIRFGNQATIGTSHSETEGAFATMNYQGNADYYLLNKLILSTSFACNYHDSFNSQLYHFNFTNANSITYAFSPHTRFRINHFYTKIREMNEVQWGILFQFTTGFGKRN